MSEIKISSAVNVGSVRSLAASTEGQVQPVRPTAAAAKVAQDDATQVAAQTVSSDADLAHALAAINEHVQRVNRDLQFSVDEELDRTVVKVVDSDSGKVIRQIPHEVVLTLARHLNNGDELHLIDALS